METNVFVIDLGHHVKSDDSRSAMTFQRIEEFF
jgi:hypothetical protein